ncbi:MAG TPA: exosortase/archaeosortase family protein [Bryobacteraceae bacterium]|nr:exosortase/archaeosortase family protein [Bryobacteraceae bacterium]
MHPGTRSFLKSLPFWLLSLAAFRGPLLTLVNLSLHDDRYSHVALIPLLSVVVMFFERKKILSDARCSLKWGIPLLCLAAVSCYGLRREFAGSAIYGLCVSILGMLLLWMAGFVFWFGPRAFRRAVFPLSLLALMIPIPDPLLRKLVLGLQHASADMSALLFRFLRVPAFREGMIFSLPGLNIEIAEQCSGIRSSIASFLASLLLGHLFLRSARHRIFLAALTLPLVIFRNALRIVTIATLAVYVNRGFLYGGLHHLGGIAFSVLDIAFFALLMTGFQKSEEATATVSAAASAGAMR